MSVRVHDGASRRGPDSLIVEEPMEIRLDDHLVTTTMRTPGHDFELAVGFCHSEGLLGGAAEAAAALGRAEEAVELATRAASAAYGQQRIPEAFHWLDLGADFAEKCPSSPAAEKLKRLFGELSRTVNEAAGGAVETQSNPEEKQP